jgi:serpin B
VVRFQRGARLAVAAGAAAALSACSGGATPVIHQGDVVEVAAGTLSAADVAQAQTAFGVDLLHAVCAAAEGPNVLLSPTSAAEALGLLYPASGGPTAAAFGDVLHLPAWSPDLVAALHEHTAALSSLRYDGDLDDDDAPDSLQMSNRLWTAPDLEPAPGYLDDIATAFAADVRALDFAGDPEGATERINTTIDEDTHGIIEELFGEPLAPTTRAVLTNAVHLKARWTNPFLKTERAPFAAASGEVTVEMMRGSSGAARSADGWTAVDLPYRDGTLAAVAILPPEGTDPCDVDAATLGGMRAGEPTDVLVELPRLTIEQSHALLDVLAGLGLPTQGDFTGLGEADLFISQIAQKTYLRVDEEGTEAAAASGEALGGAAPPPGGPVVFDRPFLFLLTDTQTRSPLFVAAVHDPSS